MYRFFVVFFLCFFFRSPPSFISYKALEDKEEKTEISKIEKKRLTIHSRPVLSYADEAKVVNEERGRNEWQGMQAPTFHPPCREGTDCGLAMACVDEVCRGCTMDDDCGAGESCVLQHCVLDAQVECRSRKGCESDALCVLSGYSDNPRGNMNMRAFCRSNSGGIDQIEDPLEREKFDKARGPRQPANIDFLKFAKDLKYEGP